MSMLDAAREAAAGRLGGSTRWRDSMMPEMPDFGALPDVSAMPAAAPAPAAPVQENPAMKRYAELRKAGQIDENGLGRDGKMFRGPQARLFVAQNGGRDHVLKDKDLAAQLNRITIAENRALGGLDPLEQDGETQQVNPVYQEQLQKKRAEKAAGFMDELEKEIGIQNDVITNADAFDALMKTEGLKTGVGQDILDTTARWLERIGADTSFLTGANRPATADALRQQVQTNVMNVLAAQKGVQTEGDAQRARETWVRLQNTPEGNLWINQYMKNIAQRKMDRANFILDEMERNGGNVRAAQNSWQKYSKDLPSVAPSVPEAPKKPEGEQPGRINGTPGFNRTQQATNADSEWEDI